MDYNLQNESDKISLQHTTALSNKYKYINELQFTTHMESQPDEFDKNNELNILRGEKVGPKECYVKHRYVPKSTLDQQFDLLSNQIYFNESTRRKLK